MLSTVTLEQVQRCIKPAAKELAMRRAAGTNGDLLNSELRPTNFEQAFAIQQAVAEIFNTTDNNPIAAWKCLLPTAEKTVVAPIYQHDVYQQSATCPLYASNQQLARVEPELAFEIARDLPPRATPYTEAEINAALGNTRLALELIKSRYHTPSEATYFDALADGLVNQGLWLGPVLNALEGVDTSGFKLKVNIQDGDTLQKTAIHPNGSAKAGLYWLVNFLSTQGVGLTQGQYVITGSYAGVLDLPLAQICHFEYGALGQFSVEFITK
ncbi:hydratase [Shewanella glacialipiscicola]|uniref:hydratase n=1 Tax=Shewanella glacialipiscicola TaxID=614069 RepID=UPI003D795D30